jgi:hypothetical protein
MSTEWCVVLEPLRFCDERWPCFIRLLIWEASHLYLYVSVCKKANALSLWLWMFCFWNSSFNSCLFSSLGKSGLMYIWLTDTTSVSWVSNKKEQVWLQIACWYIRQEFRLEIIWKFCFHFFFYSLLLIDLNFVGFARCLRSENEKSIRACLVRGNKK